VVQDSSATKNICDVSLSLKAVITICSHHIEENKVSILKKISQCVYSKLKYWGCILLIPLELTPVEKMEGLRVKMSRGWGWLDWEKEGQEIKRRHLCLSVVA